MDSNHTGRGKQVSKMKRERDGQKSSPKAIITIPAVEETRLEDMHPLENRWKFWYFDNQKDSNLSWEENLRVVREISTVEEFWMVYHAIKPPSELRQGSSLFFFKHYLKPMWEDEGNRHGGRWLLTFDRKNFSRQVLDEKWLEVLLCLIGEAFDIDGEDICGAEVDMRLKLDKISIWTKNFQNEARIMKIGRIIRQRLRLPGSIQLNYEKHVDTQNKTGARIAHPTFSL